MKTVLSLLGNLATFQRNLAAKKIGNISLNIAVLAGIALTSAGLFFASVKTASQSALPETKTVVEAGKSRIGSYSLVQGILVPKQLFAEETSAQEEWLVLMDEKSDQVLLYKRELAPKNAAPLYQANEGILKPMPAEIAQALQKKGNKVDGFPVYTDRVLVQSEPKSSPILSGVLRYWGFAALVLLLPMSIVFALGNRIFIPVRKLKVGSTQSKIDAIRRLYVTGELAENETRYLTATDAICQARQVPSGEIAIITVSKTDQIFGLLLNPSDTKVLSIGTDYDSGFARPAIQVEVKNLIHGRRSVCTITFDNESDLATFATALKLPLVKAA